MGAYSSTAEAVNHVSQIGCLYWPRLTEKAFLGFSKTIELYAHLL